MKDNFPASLAHVLASEGGLVDDPRDPGGRTNHGVTQRVYDNWRTKHGQPKRDVAQIDPNEVEAIYRSLYWSTVAGDELPAGVDYCVFDFAVNSGAKRAAVYLQRAAGADPDGKIGPETLAALKSADPLRIINSICALRLGFLESLPTFATFGRGWSNRVATVEQVARGMA